MLTRSSAGKSTNLAIFVYQLAGPDCDSSELVSFEMMSVQINAGDSAVTHWRGTCVMIPQLEWVTQVIEANLRAQNLAILRGCVPPSLLNCALCLLLLAYVRYINRNPFADM